MKTLSHGQITQHISLALRNTKRDINNFKLNCNVLWNYLRRLRLTPHTNGNNRAYHIVCEDHLHNSKKDR